MNLLDAANYHQTSLDEGWKQQNFAKKRAKLQRHTQTPSKDKHFNFIIDQKKTDEAAKRILALENDTKLNELKRANQKIKELQEKLKVYGNTTLSEEVNITVKKASRFIKQVDIFLNEITKLNTTVLERAKITKIKEQELDAKNELSTLDQSYDSLIDSYRKLEETKKTHLEKLQNAVQKCTFEYVPEKYISLMTDQFSAKLGISIEGLKANEEEFQKSFSSCKDSLKTIEEQFKKIIDNLHMTKTGLDNIDHQIVAARNPSSWNLLGAYWGEKQRLSPADKAFHAVKL